MSKKQRRLSFLVAFLVFFGCNIISRIMATDGEVTVITKENDVLQTKLSIEKNGKDVNLANAVELYENDNVQIKFNYKVISKDKKLTDGDKLIIDLPNVFGDIEPEYPKQHFKNIETEDISDKVKRITLTVGGDKIETAMGGYLYITAKVLPTSEKIYSEIKINFKEFKVTVASEIGSDNNKEMSISKDAHTDKPSNYEDNQWYNDKILFPDENNKYTDRLIHYIINVNKNSGRFNNVIINDVIPDGLSLIDSTIKVYKITNDNKMEDVTSSVKSSNPGTDGLNLGNINEQYVIKYDCKVISEKAKYINKVKVDYSNNGDKEYKECSIEISGAKSIYHTGTDIAKEVSLDNNSFNNTVEIYSQDNHKELYYRVVLNGNCEEKENLEFTDEVPKQLTLNTDSVKVYDCVGTETIESINKYKSDISENRIQIKFDKITEPVIITYTVKINNLSDEMIQNKATIKWNEVTADSTSTVVIINPKKLNEDFTKKVNGQSLTTLMPNEKGNYTDTSLNYQLMVNGFLQKKSNAVLYDEIPNILETSIDKIKILKDTGREWKDVTSNFKDSIELSSDNKLKITFGEITDRYYVDIGCKLNNEPSNSIVNKGKLEFDDEDGASHTETDEATANIIETIKGDKGLTKWVVQWDSNYKTIKDTYENNPLTKGVVIRYKILVNDKLEDISGKVLTDEIPDGMKLLTDTIKIYEVVHNRPIEITKSFEGTLNTTKNKLEVTFNKSSKYYVSYSCAIDKVKDKYENSCSFNNEKSSTEVIPGKSSEGIKEKPLIEKFVGLDYDTSSNNKEISLNVNRSEQGGIIGSRVSYRIVINEDKKYRSSMKLEDVLPSNMTLDKNSVSISSEPYTEKYSKEYNKDTNTLQIDFGDTRSKFIVTYSCIITGVSDKYINTATVTTVDKDEFAKAIVNNDNKELNTTEGKISKLIQTPGDITYKEDGLITLTKENSKLVGKKLNYRVFINTNGDSLSNAVFTDTLPSCLTLDKYNVLVYKKNKQTGQWDYHYMKVDFDEPSNAIVINFGNTDDVYKIEYQATINTELDDGSITNKAVITSGADKWEASIDCKIDKSEIKLTDGEDGLQKSVIGSKSKVNKIGDKIKYRISVNPECNILKKVKIQDYIPYGMKFIPDSYSVYKLEVNGDKDIVTDNLKSYGMSKGVLTQELGDINATYFMEYECEVVSIEKNYENKAVMETSESSERREIVYNVLFDMDCGGFNCEKLVDKNSIGIDNDDQLVTYIIRLWGDMILPKDSINIEDVIDKRVKIINVETPEDFESNIDKDTNTIHVTNKNNVINLEKYGEQGVNILIKTDFTDVKAGESIENIAEINKVETSSVKTVKGYSFSGIKLDKDTSTPLANVVFELLDEDKTKIMEMVSDSDGKIKGSASKAGKYYLREIKALDNYKLDDKLIEIIINGDSRNVDIGNIYNEKEEKVLETLNTPKGSANMLLSNEGYPSISTESQDYFGTYKEVDTGSINRETIHELPKTGDVDASHVNFKYNINLLKNKLRILLT